MLGSNSMSPLVRRGVLLGDGRCKCGANIRLRSSDYEVATLKQDSGQNGQAGGYKGRVEASASILLH